MLNSYLTQTQRLLQNPPAPVTLYATNDLTAFINIARGQIAGETACIRRLGSLSTVVGQRNYNFSSINLGTPASTGIAGVIHVRSIGLAIASGQTRLVPRPWEWFELYALNNPVWTDDQPATWAQLGQGAAPGLTGSSAGGSLYLDPPPNNVYTLSLDCVCYPNALDDDTDLEAIPYLWTDCVPFFAAYFAFMSSQGGARQADAERMFGHYQEFVKRARQAANPELLRSQYSQAQDPVQGAKLGRAAGGGGGTAA